MQFLLHNIFVVTVGVMGLVHLTLLFIMWIGGITPLMLFNILSVVVYAFCMLLCRYGIIMPVYISVVLEVTAYAVISTYYIGLRSASYCFLFSIVPIIIYFGSYLFKGLLRLHIAVMLALNFATFVFLYVRFSNAPPIYEMSPPVRMTLVLFTSFAMIFATIFYNMIYIYSSEHEVIALTKRNKQLSHDVKNDALTNLLNRRGFLPEVEHLMEGTDNHFCIAFCDIDDFKRVNDSFGHDAGDEVLRHIAGIIKNEMPGCPVCRWGGEEMVILMKDYDMAVARTKMEYIRKTVETTPTVFYSRIISVTITIGVVEYNQSYAKSEEIIKVADDRMYYGKQHGKNMVVSAG